MPVNVLIDVTTRSQLIVIINEGSLHNNWVGLPNDPTTIQPAVSNQTGEVNQQPIISKEVITEKTLKEILKDINKQVLETKYTLNLGQLLWAIPNIKHYIFNSVPSKSTLLEPTIASIAINHQMVIIQAQVGKNFIENTLLDGGFGVHIITKKLKV